jgi:gluconokinase
MVIALDVGTSSARAAVYDHSGTLIPQRFHQVAYEARVTPDGGVEHDAGTLFGAVVRCLDAVQSGSGLPDISGVGVCTFWHGLLGFDAGKHPATPIYLWADTRSAEDATLLAGALDEERLRARTGCHLHPSYWPAKLRWLARERPDAFQRVARWGSIGEFLELQFFGEAATSVSMASGTGLFDQDGVTWDIEAVAAAGLEPHRLFPLVERRQGRLGLRAPWSHRWPALRTAAWFPAVGDGAASNVGSGCIGPDRIALNVGTSGALRVLPPIAPLPRRGLWRYRLDATTPIVGGATSEGGNVYTWCQDTLRLPASDAIEAALATAAARQTDLTALPFLAGERSPGWRARRRAAIVGLGLDTSAVDILRAMLEAVALRLAVIYDLLAPCAARDHVVVGSGGALERSPAWTRIIADSLGQPIALLGQAEASGRGAALLALESLGLVRDLRALGAPLRETVMPDAARHARYRNARARQQTLDERV